MSETDTQSRNYCFTINNWNQEEYDTALSMRCKYIVIGKEIGKEGTPHLQCFVTYKDVKKFSAVKKLLPRAHIEEMKATPLLASNYCKKENDWEERGEAPKGAGSRSDLDLARETIKKTGKMKDVVEVCQSYQSIRMTECWLKYAEAPRSEKPHVSWYFGATGTGKSKQAYEELGEDVYTCLSTGKWFEGYDAHENVLIDDMRKDFLKFHELLRLLDRYAMRVECKGGSRQFKAKRIIITSAYSPNELFDTREDLQQLLRRIDVIRCFDTDA